MKLTQILSAALVAGAISASAATQPVAAAAGTNANPETAMKALFGDPVIVKAKIGRFTDGARPRTKPLPKYISCSNRILLLDCGPFETLIFAHKAAVK